MEVPRTVGDDDVDAQLEEHFFGPARRRQGAQRWSEAHDTGTAMTFEEAVVLAVTPSAGPDALA